MPSLVLFGRSSFHFCLMSHLSFRTLAPTDAYPRLERFCQRFAERASALETPYRFDD